MRMQIEKKFFREDLKMLTSRNQTLGFACNLLDKVYIWRDGTHTMLGGCEMKFRNLPHETWLAIRYKKNTEFFYEHICTLRCFSFLFFCSQITQYINNNKNCCPFLQCCRSMTFWCGSGSGGPCLWPVDPDPAIFVIDLQDANKKLIFLFLFFLLLTFWRYIYIIFHR